MLNAAANEEFEQAANYRDKLGMLEKVKEKRLVAINRFLDADIVSFVTNNVYSAVNLLVIRKGVMLGERAFPWRRPPSTARRRSRSSSRAIIRGRGGAGRNRRQRGRGFFTARRVF